MEAKADSLSVREFEEVMAAYARNSPLPAEVKRLAVREVERRLKEEAAAEIAAQLQERKEREAEGQQDEPQTQAFSAGIPGA